MGERLARTDLLVGALLLVLLGGGSTHTGSGASMAPPAPGDLHGAITDSRELPSRVAARRTSGGKRTATTPRWSGAVDVTSRSAVDAAYRRDFAPGLRVPTGWAGSDSRCIAGTQSSGSRTATLRALNFTRSLGGLAPVSFSSDLNARSQQTALLMSANDALSHAPPRSWRCYTAAAAANAGKSNLSLSYPSNTSSGIVAQYLEDAGSTNTAAGHRRWLLNPFSTTMGSGATDTANAITVIGPTSTSRPNPAAVSWPTAGWFPRTLEPSGRWSLSLGDRSLSFRWAAVRVWRDGKPIKAVKHPVADGYAQPTLVWQIPASLARSGTFKVEVSSIRATAKSTRYTRTYTVRMFAPGT